MFLDKSKWIAAGLALAMITGCGSGATLFAERSKSEAAQLQALCQRTGLVSEDTRQADAFLASANKSQQDGDEKSALRAADRGAILYRLALAKRERAETETGVIALRAALAKDKDKLQTYQQVLEEVKAVRNP